MPPAMLHSSKRAVIDMKTPKEGKTDVGESFSYLSKVPWLSAGKWLLTSGLALCIVRTYMGKDQGH